MVGGVFVCVPDDHIAHGHQVRNASNGDALNAGQLPVAIDVPTAILDSHVVHQQLEQRFKIAIAWVGFAFFGSFLFQLVELFAQLIVADFGDPISKEKCALAVEHAVELVQFLLRKRIGGVATKDAMVILENLQGVGPRVVCVGDALALEFDASREEEQGNEKEGEAALHEPTLPNRCRMHKAKSRAQSLKAKVQGPKSKVQSLRLKTKGG